MKFKSIFLLLVLISCSYHVSKSQNNIKISVAVKNIPDQGFSLSYLRSVIRSFKFDKNNHAECIIEDLDYTYATIHNGFKEARLMYFEKGDHVHLSFDGESMAKSLILSGARKAITNYLDSVQINWLPDEAFALEVPEFIDRLKKLVVENQKLVNSQAKELTAESKKFVKIERNRIKYMMGLSILDYVKAHGQMTKIKYTPGQDYYDALLDWMEEDPDFIHISEYRTIITEGIFFILSQSAPISSSYEKVMKQIEYIQTNFKNDRVKQFFINNLVSNYVEEYGIIRTKELQDFHRQHVKDKDLLTQYQKIHHSWTVVAPGQKAPDFQAVDSTGKAYSLKDFRGKYVCLYFWPTVQPSLNEFTYLQKMRSLFDERNVTLVNLSIDQNPDSWKQCIQNKDLQIGTHLFLGWDKNLLNTYHYKSNYMYIFVLIDPEGKIIEIHAPNPSTGKMEEFIKNNTLL